MDHFFLTPLAQHQSAMRSKLYVQVDLICYWYIDE